MTDDKKLELLDNIEFSAWDKIGHWKLLEELIRPLELIERCQRIRANLKRVAIEYETPRTPDGEWIK